MLDTPFHRRQAPRGLEQLASLVRAQSWRQDGTPGTSAPLLPGGADACACTLDRPPGILLGQEDEGAVVQQLRHGQVQLDGVVHPVWVE